MPILSVLISDDYPMVRLAISQILKSTFSNLIVKVATSDDLREMIQNHKFDIIILDNDLSIENNLSLVNAIRLAHPAVKILFFSDRNEQIFALPLLHAGADGFITKDATEEDFKTALLQLFNGKKYVSKKLQQKIMNEVLEGVPTFTPTLSAILTDREIQVMNLLLRGYRTAEISNEMNLRPSTISTFKMKIMKKMRVGNIVELSEKMKAYDNPYLRKSARVG